MAHLLQRDALCRQVIAGLLASKLELFIRGAFVSWRCVVRTRVAGDAGESHTDGSGKVDIGDGIAGDALGDINVRAGIRGMQQQQQQLISSQCRHGELASQFASHRILAMLLAERLDLLVRGVFLSWRSVRPTRQRALVIDLTRRAFFAWREVRAAALGALCQRVFSAWASFWHACVKAFIQRAFSDWRDACHARLKPRTREASDENQKRRDELAQAHAELDRRARAQAEAVQESAVAKASLLHHVRREAVARSLLAHMMSRELERSVRGTFCSWRAMASALQCGRPQRRQLQTGQGLHGNLGGSGGQQDVPLQYGQQHGQQNGQQDALGGELSGGERGPALYMPSGGRAME
eukprot:NODE_4765_length_1850_cov_14.154382.p1 GENE.NODE_4765_length_1850_cov_14.154382~~NODE_4765_length_1850_cov_14.154382.p1  ORF type:complete len:412 (+),score=67.12 NODE_4765_length_1850_cov_14.154382:183-1238(+)